MISFILIVDDGSLQFCDSTREIGVILLPRTYNSWMTTGPYTVNNEYTIEVESRGSVLNNGLRVPRFTDRFRVSILYRRGFWVRLQTDRERGLGTVDGLSLGNEEQGRLLESNRRQPKTRLGDQEEGFGVTSLSRRSDKT